MTYGNVKTETIEQFVNGEIVSDLIIAATLNIATQQLLNTTSADVLFSKESLNVHLVKHPEITAKDYQLIPEIIENGEIYRQNEKRYVLLHKNGKLYRASIKTTQHGEIYFLSLFP
jgi:hypothetical protein